MSDQSKAVVLLSGGQDSTTCFYWALDRFDLVEAVSFDYGQRHKIELELAEATAAKNDVPWDVLPVEALKQLGGGSLTNPEIANVGVGGRRPGKTEAANVYAEKRGLPPSFIPGRNVLFFALAAAYAVQRGIETIVTGVCQQDHSGYPDCRAVFVEQMQKTLQLALDAHGAFKIEAPLLWLDKSMTWKLAETLGVLDEIILQTHTCYEGVHDNPHEWGYGCGECGACVERRRGYEEFRRAQALARA